MKLTAEKLAAALCEMDHREWEEMPKEIRTLYRTQAERFFRAVNKLKPATKNQP